MKVLLLVETDETTSVTISQEGHADVTVAPGQNASIEVLSTHSVTISIPEAVAEEPEAPAAPVVADTPASVDLVAEAPAVPAAPTGGLSTPGIEVNGVVSEGAPDELKAVAVALADVNSAVGAVAVAQADAIGAAQNAIVADKAAGDFTAPEDMTPEHAETVQADLDQKAADAKASAETAAEDHAAAIDTANEKLEAMHAVVEVVENAAADPANLVTDAHADQAQALLQGAIETVEALPPLDGSMITQDPPAPPADAGPEAISPAGDTGTTEDGAGNATTGPTVVDEQLADAKPTVSDIEAAIDAGKDVSLAPDGTATIGDQPEPRDATEAEIGAAIQECLDEDAPTTASGTIVLQHLNAKLTAKGLKPIDAVARDQAHAALANG